MSETQTVQDKKLTMVETVVGAKPCPDTFASLATDVLDKLKGRTITLPAISVRDAIPHMSRHARLDTTRKGWLTQPADFDRKHCLQIISQNMILPDLSCRRPINVSISKWEPVEDRPLLYRMEVIAGGQRRIIRLHIRHGKPADQTMVQETADMRLPLLECYADDIDPGGKNPQEQLTRLLLGKTGRLEWLYHPMAWSLATLRYRIIWRGCGGAGRAAVNHLSETPAFAAWKDHTTIKRIGLTVWETHLAGWDATIQVRAVEGASIQGDSLYDIPGLVKALTNAEPPSEAEQPTLEQLADVEPMEPDYIDTDPRYEDDRVRLDGLRILHIDCWKCAEDIIAWWLPESQPYPEDAPRLEELPEVVNEVKRRLHGDYRSLESMCEFDDRWSKTTESDVRAFICPYCNRVQGDSHIRNAWRDACLDDERLANADSRSNQWRKEA